MAKKKTEQKFETKEFHGAVILKDWMNYPETGQSHIGFVGKISIVNAMDVLGFEVQKTETNWAALVQGPRSNVWLFGCQIRSIIADAEVKANGVNFVNVV